MTLWVFAYGSLLWDPGFAVAERAPACLPGWRRSFCMWSVVYRGTPVAPGLVLALDADAGGLCGGLALRAEPGTEAATRAYLQDRELISSAYLERELPVDLADGRQVTALTYVIDRGHDQYAGRLALTEQARIIAEAAGDRGPNRDYLWNTAAHLTALGITDPDMVWLADQLRGITAS